MANNVGKATWKGGLKEGNGIISAKSKMFRLDYSFESRFGDENVGTNPEELIGASHAACYSMFLASLLEKAGLPPTKIETDAEVTLSKDDTGPFISKIELSTYGEVPGMDQEDFEEHAKKAEKNCPISRALKAIPEVILRAELKQSAEV